MLSRSSSHHWIWTLVLILWTPPAAPEQPARQRIHNGGFEKGLTGWKIKEHTLVEDPGAAHRGERCVQGEVTRRNQGQALRRTLKLRKDKLYRLALWARTDKRSRLTIWLHTAGRGEVIANWEWVPRKWRRYQVNFTVEQDGPATLRIVAPSSFWAPAGRMWIDDVSLIEQPLRPQLEVSAGVGFNDSPVMAPSGPETAWVAWISFRGGQDTLQAARLKVSAGNLELAETREVAGGRILDPVLAGSDDGEAWLVYAQEHQENWDLHAVHLTKEGPKERVQITKDPAVDVHPAVTTSSRTLWIAWESNRDASQRHIYLVGVRNGVPEQPQRLSADGVNSYQPAVAALESGQVWAAWHSFKENNYDLYARSFSDGNKGPELRLTRAPGIDRSVRLFARGQQLWLAWEHASYTGYQLGKATTKRVQVARLEGERLQSPAGLKKTGLWSLAETPELKLLENNLWMAALVPRDRKSGWDVRLWQYGKNGWALPRVISRQKGMNRRPGMAVFPGAVASCYQGDDMPGRWLSVEKSSRGKSGVFCTTIEQSGDDAENELRLVPYQPPDDKFEAAALRIQRGEDRSGWTVDVREKKLRLLFGDLHEHSDLSVCDRTRDETPDQSYQMMRDVARYDFGALTDHGKCFNAYLWSHQGKMTRANHDPGRFTTLLALEWTSTFERRTRKYPFGYYGHRNLFFTDPFFPKWYNAAGGTTPAELWETLKKDKADFVLIPHQLADKGNVPVDWNFHDEIAEPVAEIFQFRGSYECRGCPRQAKMGTPKGYYLQDAWARGIVIGVVAAPDHEGGLGKAAVYAEDSTRQAIFQALRQRRTYGTTSAKIFLDVRVNGLFMGEVGEPPQDGPVRVDVRVDCPAPIRSVEIIRNNKTVYRAKGKGKQMEFGHDVPPPKGPAYYYVRVIQKDEEMAWSSPVWLRRGARE